MLEIISLYKEKKESTLSNISLNVAKESIVSLECSSEASQLLISMIIGRETPSKGEIYIDKQPVSEYVRRGFKNIGVVFLEEGLYERLTVEDYLKFFSEAVNSHSDYKQIMMKLALLDIGNVKIKDLSYSQRRRLCFARERLKELKLLIIQEPILNMDRENSRIVIENIEELRADGVAILCTSVSYKDAILLGGKAYTLEADGGLKEVHQDLEGEEHSIAQKESDRHMFKIEKIPAREDERILLFNPMEIDFVESEQGISNLNIRGDKFICTLSLNELEKRLKAFGFYRCHRSYIVNLQRVREIASWTRNSYSLILDDKNKSAIPLSKGRMDELKDVLGL